MLERLLRIAKQHGHQEAWIESGLLWIKVYYTQRKDGIVTSGFDVESTDSLRGLLNILGY